MVPLAVSLVVIPIYLDLIGEARYGVLAIAWLLLGYFGLFDLGLGRATAQRIAVLKGASAEDRAQVFWTALAMNAGFGIIGGLLIWPVANYFFGNVFKIEEALRPEMLSAVPWLILAVPISTLGGVLSGALLGRERFLELNLISVCGSVMSLLIPLGVAVYWDVGLDKLLPAALIWRIITLVILYALCQRYIILGHSPSFEKEEGSRLIRFGGWVTVTSFIGPVMVILDRFVIGAISGAKAVSYYTIPFQLGERSTILPLSLVSALFPRLAGVSSAEEQRLARAGQEVLVVVMTPLVLAGVLFMEPFIAWWISREFAEQSAQVGQIILLGFWFNSFAKIPLAQLQARGRPDLVAKCHLAEVLPYLGLLYIGISVFGLIGAAFAFSLRVVFDTALLTGLAGVLGYSLRLILFPAILLILALIITMNSSYGELDWMVYTLSLILIAVVWAWWRAPATLRNFILNCFMLQNT